MKRAWVVAMAALTLGESIAQPPPRPAAVLGEPGGTADNRVVVPPAFAPRPPEQDRGPEPSFGSLYGVGILAARNGIPGYGATWFPSQNVADQPQSLSLFRHEGSIFAPLEQDGADTATVGFSFRNSLFTTDAILPTTRKPFPNTFWDISAGAAFAHQFDNGWTGGAVISGGSASDKPFKQADVLNAAIALYLTIPAIDRDYWAFGVYYSPTAEFAYPIPGIAYFWRPGPDLEVNIGVPFLLRWQPWEDMRFDLFYFPIRTVSARASWEFFPDTWAYAGFDWSNESYFLADRENRGDRLFSYEKRLAGGVSFDLPYKLRFDVSAGYAFDRFYFQGSRYADRDRDRVNVGNGFFGALQLRIQF